MFVRHALTALSLLSPQLRHAFTRKYIHASTTLTSRSESNNMLVSNWLIIVFLLSNQQTYCHVCLMESSGLPLTVVTYLMYTYMSHLWSHLVSHWTYCHFQIELLDYNGKHAQFKVMPRYKVKAEGDVVSNVSLICLWFDWRSVPHQLTSVCRQHNQRLLLPTSMLCHSYTDYVLIICLSLTHRKMLSTLHQWVCQVSLWGEGLILAEEVKG